MAEGILQILGKTYWTRRRALAMFCSDNRLPTDLPLCVSTPTTGEARLSRITASLADYSLVLTLQRNPAILILTFGCV